jgi:UDP-glucose 4-epimerase
VLYVKVLVPGGAGFIGSWVVERLLGDGHEVVVFDNFSTGDRRNLAGVLDDPHLSIVEGDIRDRDTVDREAAGCQATVHLAAVTSVEEATENPELACSVNVMGTLHLLDAARWNGHSRFVYASSVAVYGEPDRLPVSESQPPRPLSVYGASKLAAEGLVHAYRHTYGLSTVALRLFNVYGPRQKKGTYAGVIQRFIQDSASKGRITVDGDGGQTRDFVYVKDVADALVLALGKDVGGAINIGSGRATSIGRLAGTFARIKPGLKVTKGEPRAGDIRFSRASIAMARARLGWRPTTPLGRGLAETLRYFSSVEQP